MQILFATPDQLDGLAGMTCEPRCLHCDVVADHAPAETSADWQVVNFDVIRLDAHRSRDIPGDEIRRLRAEPHVTATGLPFCGAGERFECSMRQIGNGIARGQRSQRRTTRRGRLGRRFTLDCGNARGCVERREQRRMHVRRRGLFRPFQLQGCRGALGSPVTAREHRDAARNPHDIDDALDGARGVGVRRGGFARTARIHRDRCVQHAFANDIHSVTVNASYNVSCVTVACRRDGFGPQWRVVRRRCVDGRTHCPRRAAQRQVPVIHRCACGGGLGAGTAGAIHGCARRGLDDQLVWMREAELLRDDGREHRRDPLAHLDRGQDQRVATVRRARDESGGRRRRCGTLRRAWGLCRGRRAESAIADDGTEGTQLQQFATAEPLR